MRYCQVCHRCFGDGAEYCLFDQTPTFLVDQLPVIIDGKYRLDGVQTVYYFSGAKQWEATFAAGRRAGTETFWRADGSKRWEKVYGPDGTWLWRRFDAAGKVLAESQWKGKDLVEARVLY